MLPQTPPGQSADEPPTPEELLALVELLQQQGLAKDQIPPDLQTLLDNVKRQKAAKGGVPQPPDAPTEEITPDPGFVIKTSETASGRKVFINVCSSPRVAAPGGWTDGVMPDEVAAALEKLQGADGDTAAAGMTAGEVEALRFPLACGPPRTDTDRKGAACTVVDVVFNSDVVRAAAAERRLKAMLIEVSTGWVANKLKSELDPRYKLPRMRYKGEVVASQRIRADDKRKKLVTELRDVDEEPSFALRTRKAPTPPAAAATAASGTPAAATAAAATAAASAATAAASGGKSGSAGVAVDPAARRKPDGAAAGPSGRAAAEPPPAVAATAAAAASRPSYKVEYEGRPVEWVRVTLDLPSSGLGRSVQGPTGQSPADPGPAQQAYNEPIVEICGRTLFVSFPGQPEVQVPLLFAVSAEGATATRQPAAAAAAGAAAVVGAAAPEQLVVRLPYRSLDEHLADARSQAPLAFGQLSFASKALLELEP